MPSGILNISLTILNEFQSEDRGEGSICCFHTIHCNVSLSCLAQNWPCYLTVIPHNTRLQCEESEKN